MVIVSQIYNSEFKCSLKKVVNTEKLVRLTLTMRFYKPADSQPCYYCEKIEVVEKGYPIREGIYTLENYVFRCGWHARFKCSKCTISEIVEPRPSMEDIQQNPNFLAFDADR